MCMWTKKEWDKIEEDTLRRVYTDPKWTFDEIAELFPKRTHHAIRSKASRMGLKRPYLDSTERCPLCGQELHQKETQP